MKLNLLIGLLLGSNILAADPLPRVLILGDITYQGMSVASELTARAQVVYANPGDSSHALAHLDELLGKDKCDVIYFNFGIADLCYKDPSIKGIRAMSKQAGGVRVTTPEVYEKNLIAIVTRLKATGAKLIWASTVPPTGFGETNYDRGSENEYNDIAAKIMSAQNVPVNDLRALAPSSPKDPKRTAFQEAFVKAILAELEPVKK